MAHATGTGSGAAGLADIQALVVTETAGAAAAVTLRDSTSGGPILMRINVAANDTVGMTFPKGWHLDGQFYVEVTTGTVRWTLVG